jgi:hypothetical protein
MTSEEAYKEYKSLHRRFESGDLTVSEKDVHRAYSKYCSIHSGEGDGKSRKSPDYLSCSNRPREEQSYPVYGVGKISIFGRIWPKGY